MVDFYIDYAQLMLDREDYLPIAMLLKRLDESEPEAAEQVRSVLYVMDKKADIKVRKALDEHHSRLYRKRR